MLAMPACLELASSALAHASLISSVPEDGAVLGAVPQRYALTFNEPVSPLSLRLVQPDGSALSLDRFELKDHTVEIAAPAGLEHGTYALSWRVISEDGHPVGGAVVFSIGAPSAAPPDIEEPVDWTVRAGIWTGKVALYVGLFIGVGGTFAAAWLLGGTRHGRAAIFAALPLGLIGALMSVGFQGLDALDVDASRLGDPLVWRTGIATSFGLTILAAILAMATAAIAMLLSGAKSRLASLNSLLLTGLALAISGHASAAEPQWLMRPAVFLHGVIVAWWTGALMPLGLALRRNPAGAADALQRFSARVPYAVAALIAAGVVLAVVQIEQPGALLDTDYGRVFLVKLALLALLFALAAFNRWRLTGRVASGDAPATKRLARAIAAEVAFVLLILAAVACWRFTPPPRALAIAAAQPATTHIHTAKAMADVTVTPGRAGPVAVSIFPMTGDFDPLAAKEVTLVLTNPQAGIEPIRRPARNPGDGIWRVDRLTLPVAGVWHIRLDLLISDFDMVQLEGEIRIKP